MSLQLVTQNGQESADDSHLVATFQLGDAAFGIGAAHVQEVVRVGDITPVHHAPPFVIGIRNLRGKIVTVIDLRVRLDLGNVEAGADNRILIVDWQGEPVGLLVDSIADTIAVNPADIVPPPPNLHGVQSRNLGGVYRSGERLVALLDHGTVLRLDERTTPAGSSEKNN